MKTNTRSAALHCSGRTRMLELCAALCAALAVLPMAALHAPLANAQTQTQSSAPAGQKLTNQQLDSLTAPIALYPDALLAQVLMASTYPQEVGQAAQWSQQNPNVKGDDAVKAVQSQPWDPSVQSLVAFPQALATMASKPDWMTQLGNAFVAQPSDVMDSVQRLRRAAQTAGNLKTTEQQKVVVQQAPSTSVTTIQIEPANPQVVYVPTYNPTVVYGAWPYPAYPPVYVPPPPGYAIATGFATGLAFGAGVAVANSLWGNCDWNHGNVNVNVNRYNNINVNNRLNANSNNVRWNRNDPQFNRNNVNNNLANRQNNFNNQNLGGANRDQFRGRDEQRAQAAQTLQQRTGQNLNQSAQQRAQNIRSGGGENARTTSNLNQRAQNVNRDNALRGAGDGNAARQDAQRGQASRQAFQNQQGNRMGANGGGVQRSGGGLGANGGGVHREGGGGFHGGGGGFGGGGGGFHRR